MRALAGPLFFTALLLGPACKDASQAAGPAAPPIDNAGVPNPPELGAGEEPPLVDAGSLEVGTAAEVEGAAPADAEPLLGCAEGPYFPVQVGNSWQYSVRSKFGGSSTVKLNRVVAHEPVPVEGPHQGKMAFRFETFGGDSGGMKAVSWQAMEGDRLVRYAERQFDPKTQNLEQISYWEPYRVRFDGAFSGFTLEQRWSETYQDYKSKWDIATASALLVSTAHVDQWIVQAVDEVVTVPAGRFKTLRVKKLLNSTSDERGKTYWFARCVGKVKETPATGAGAPTVPGAGRDELLTAFTVVP